MWQGFVGLTIAARNKELARWNLLLLAACFAVLLGCSRWIANTYMGPRIINAAQLASAGDTTFSARNYISVTGDKVVNSGLTETTKRTRNGGVESQSTTAEFMGLMVGSRILIVKARPGQRATSYKGELVSLPGDVKDRIFKRLDADIQAAFLPVMLDASEDYDDGLVALGIALLIPLSIAAWNLLKWRRRSSDPTRHPFVKALAKYGPLETIVPQVDAEVASGYTILGNSVTATKGWFLQCSFSAVKAMRTDDVLWAYMKRTKHSVNFIPTGTTFSSLIWDSRGQNIETTGTEQQVLGLLTALANAMPWIIVGYDAKVQTQFRKDRNALAAVVAQRRQEIIKRAGVHA